MAIIQRMMEILEGQFAPHKSTVILAQAMIEMAQEQARLTYQIETLNDKIGSLKTRMREFEATVE